MLDPPLDDVSSPGSSSSSPAGPLSPAPGKQDKKAKRRRESGLLRPVQEAKTPERPLDPVEDISQWEEGEGVQMTQEDAAVLLGSEPAASSEPTARLVDPPGKRFEAPQAGTAGEIPRSRGKSASLIGISIDRR